MKRKRGWIFLVGAGVLALLGYLGVQYSRSVYKESDGFSLASIRFEYPYQRQWETNPLSEQDERHLDKIFQMKFHYLSKGARSFAFLSDDGNFVLKFFKNRYAAPHWSTIYLPNVWPFKSFIQKKREKVSLKTVLSGYKIAYDLDPVGTGVLYISLNPLKKQKEVEVFDKKGQRQKIPLAGVRFIIQKKVKELSEILDEHLQKEDKEEAKKVLLQTMDLYHFHYKKGLYDLGKGLVQNNGFIEGRPVHFDVSKLTLDPRIYDLKFRHLAFLRLVGNVDGWLARNYPKYREEIVEELKMQIQTLRDH